MGAALVVLGSSAVNGSAAPNLAFLCDALANDRRGEDGGFACSCLGDVNQSRSTSPSCENSVNSHPSFGRGTFARAEMRIGA
jgi:hypothetical protein